MNAVIQAEALSKTFGKLVAVDDLSFSIVSGECFGILGPNGAGKTTLIKMLAGILSPSTGQVLINGLSLKDDAEAARRQIGVVSHQTFLYGNLTACENLEFYSRMYDVTGRRARIEQVVAMVGMTSRLHDRVSTLSRGMQQRLSIARCLLHKPSIILLDEPETGLDQQATSSLWDILQTGEKRTIILTTHSLERGRELCGRMLILVRGKIAYEGSSQALDLAGLRQAYQSCTGVSA